MVSKYLENKIALEGFSALFSQISVDRLRLQVEQPSAERVVQKYYSSNQVTVPNLVNELV